MITLGWEIDNLQSGKDKDITTSQLATVKLEKLTSFKMSTMEILKVSGLMSITHTV